MHTWSILVVAVLAPLGAIAMTRPGTDARPPADESPRPLVVLTGRDGGADTPVWSIARSQEVLADSWSLMMGDAGPRAAQGWHLVPTIDFEHCDVLLIASGPATNSNGYRVREFVESHNAVTVRVEAISFQTASTGGADGRIPANPWAIIVISRTDKTIFLEENVQNLIGGEPIWRRRNAFPGIIGVGAPVEGTRQFGDR